MMKINSISLLAVLALALTGCAKVVPRSDHPFNITVSKVMSYQVHLDIVPENNDFKYYPGVITRYDYSRYSCAEIFVDAVDKELRRLYEIQHTTVPFDELFLYTGAQFYSQVNLKADTEYYAFAIPYDDQGRPEAVVVTEPFKTASGKRSDITFGAELQGSMLTIIPSNGDQYFADYERKKEIDEYYYSPYYFYETMVQLYWEYDFLDYFLVRGKETTDISDYYDLTPGDRFYLVAAGFENGTNSDVQCFLITYNGKDEPGTVEPGPSLESYYEEGANSSKSSVRLLNQPLSRSPYGFCPLRFLWRADSPVLSE